MSTPDEAYTSVPRSRWRMGRLFEIQCGVLEFATRGKTICHA